MIGIYILTSPSGKRYIGQSVNIKQRMVEHKRMLKKQDKDNSKLANAFRKYGFEKFEVQVLVECTEDMLDEYEISFIEKYNTLEDGYNSRNGGKANHRLTDEHKAKLSAIFKGVYNGKQNQPFYIDSILYMSISEASRDLNIPFKTIHNRLNSPNQKYKDYYYRDKEKVVNPLPRTTEKRKCCTIDGVEYHSINAASQKLGISYMTLLRRIKDSRYPNCFANELKPPSEL